MATYINKKRLYEIPFLRLSQKGGKKVRGLEFLFTPLNLRQREKGSMGIGKNKSFDFGSIKKKKKKNPVICRYCQAHLRSHHQNMSSNSRKPSNLSI